jgi:hypothetical protein
VNTKSLFAAVAAIVGLAGARPAPASFGQDAVVIALDPAITHQTFTGWEATDFFGEPGSAPWPYFAAYRDLLFDKVVNDYGINRIRLELPAGTENNTDYFSQYMAGAMPQRRYVHCFCRAPVNDDADPAHIDPAGFQFSQLDWKLDNSVVPLRRLVAAKGEQLLVNLDLVSFNWIASECPDMPYTPGWLQYNFPDEYAELFLAAFLHMRDKYGFVPDTIQVMLEPDDTAFNGTKMGQAMLATERVLSESGFHPKYVVPSTTSMANAVRYFNAIKAVVGDAFVRAHVQELSYHRYGGASDANLAAIAATSVEHGIGASMLEWWGGSTYETLYQDLTAGRNTAWQEGTILGLYQVSTADPDHPVVSIAEKSKYIRQYARYIRPGALRIEATSTDPGLAPVAFVDRGGGYVVVLKAAAGGPFEIRGLAPGTYGLTYTTAGRSDAALPDVTIDAGAALASAIPAPGAITIYARGAARPTPTPPTGPTPTLTPPEACLPFVAVRRDR